MTISFGINGTEHQVIKTDKAANIEAFAVKGVRWFQKTYGNTYHVAYISALINGQWLELGKTAVQYGYGEHYLVTAGAWLVENGFIECNNEYFLADYSVRDALKVEHYSKDVQRKRDM